MIQVPEWQNTKYLNQHKSFVKADVKIKQNKLQHLNGNIYQQVTPIYVLINKEKLFSILVNVKSTLFRIYFPKKTNTNLTNRVASFFGPLFYEV